MAAANRKSELDDIFTLEEEHEKVLSSVEHCVSEQLATELMLCCNKYDCSAVNMTDSRIYKTL